jgi:hypothetical protein
MWIRSRGERRDLFNIVMNLRVPEKAGNFFTSRANISFSNTILLHADINLFFLKLKEVRFERHITEGL